MTGRAAGMLLGTWVLGCHGTQAEPVKKKEAVVEDGARCQSKQDLERLDGKSCVVVGTYRQVDLRMRKTPPPVYNGRVAVVLADGTQVLLEPSWSKAGVREEKERTELDGKPVEVKGAVHLRAPEPDSGEAVAQLTGPCVTKVEWVRGK